MEVYCQEEIDDIFNDDCGNENNCQDNVIRSRFSHRNHGDEIPLVEKYRPKKFEEVVHQDEIVRVLKTTIQTGELPHLLFH